jgi:hypothetical protein
MATITSPALGINGHLVDSIDLECYVNGLCKRSTRTFARRQRWCQYLANMATVGEARQA